MTIRFGTRLLVVLAVPTFALAQQPAAVSLVQVLATPERYHGQRVRVEGFLHCEFEDSALYLSKSDGDYLIGRNAIWVSYSAETQKSLHRGSEKLPVNVRCDANRKYVLLEGRFNPNGHGHMDCCSGELEDVTRLMELKRWSE